MQLPEKVKTRVTYDPALALLGIYLKKTKNANLQRHMYTIVNIPLMAANTPLMGKWIKKMSYTHTKQSIVPP